jgi:hypothetical protein
MNSIKNPLWDPITQQEQSQEFIDGRNARFNGFLVVDNPYDDLAHIEEYWERNPDGENIQKYQDWDKGWTRADAQLRYNAEMFEKMKSSTPSKQDRFVVELEALLTKYNYRITGVDNVHDYLYFKEGPHKRYDFAAEGTNGSFLAARPIGG